MRGLVTVFGGSGFVGAHIVRALVRRGVRVRVAVREPSLAYSQRLLGEPGQIEIVQANIRDAASVSRALDGAEGCVNAVGVLWEAGRQTFSAIHAQGSGVIAAAAKAAGVTRLTHISAIGASAASSSVYARSKAEGEAAVREAFPDAVILRPSVVFGQGDGFFEKFATMAVFSPALPLIGGGVTRFQPVFVGDVAEAVAESLINPAHAGGVFELGGPEVYSFAQLMRIILAEISRRRLLVPLPYGLASLVGLAGDIVSKIIPWTPLVTSDQVRLLKSDNVVSQGAAGLPELGVTPQPLEAVIGAYLYRYRPGGQYAEAIQAGLHSR